MLYSTAPHTISSQPAKKDNNDINKLAAAVYRMYMQSEYGWQNIRSEISEV